MRLRLLPAALALAAILPARPAAADDGENLRRTPYAPIAGTPIPSSYDWETDKLARNPGLVIAGAVVGSVGIAGALTGLVLMSTGTGGCPLGTLAAPNPCPATGRDIGRIMLPISGAVAAAGLTMVLVGIQPEGDASSARARLLPAAAIGPTGGTLTWRF